MKISKDASGKTTVDFGGAVLPSGEKIEDLLKRKFKLSLVDVLREFGAIGVVTYVGGVILLVYFPFVKEFNKQLLFGLSGLFLLTLSVFISYFRIKTRSEKEKALIDMVQNTGNRLAEKLEGMPKEQVVSITQTIWQNQKDLINAIVSGAGKIDIKDSVASK